MVERGKQLGSQAEFFVAEKRARWTFLASNLRLRLTRSHVFRRFSNAIKNRLMKCEPQIVHYYKRYHTI